MDIQYLTLLERILFLLVEFCRNAPGSYCRGCVDAGCCLECYFCWVELTGSLLVLCRPYGWILPCRMLRCTGNSHWKMPCNDLHGMTRDEPCSCSRRINSVCRIVFFARDDWKLAGLRVVLCRMWKHHCTRR